MVQNKQPKALYLLASVQMWEWFSFYGMRALLVLYMISELRFSELQAFSIYAAYTGLVELGGIVGGMIADRLLGTRASILLGGWIIACGHICLAFSGNSNGLFAALAIIVVGSSLFSTNIAALLGSFYDEKDHALREAGFTLYYIGINAGGLIASIACGVAGEYLGWHIGFGLAAGGMLIGIASLHIFKPVLQGKGVMKSDLRTKEKALLALLLSASACALAFGLQNGIQFLAILPWACAGCCLFVLYRLHSMGIGFTKLASLVLFIAAQVLFYAAEEQIGSSFMALSERYADNSFLGFAFAPSLLMGLNPLVIVTLGTALSRVAAFGQIASLRKLMAAFFIAASAFCLLAFAASTGNSMPTNVLVAAVILISIAELCVGPVVYSICSEISASTGQSSVMGFVPMGFALSSFVGGHLSLLMTPANGATPILHDYAGGFGTIASLLGMSGAAILGVTFFGSRLLIEEKQKGVL